MPFLFLILIIIAYAGLGTFAVHKVFPAANPTMIAIALTVSNAVGFLAVVLNGFIPPIPLSANDWGSFLFVSFLGLAAANAIALMFTIDSLKNNLLIAIIVSSAINLGLTIVLGIPCFNAVLSVSNLLFKT